MKDFKEKIKGEIADLVKNEICKSALEILREKGYFNCTMNEIAHRAGVSVGTVYNYFNDKQCLLFYLKKCLAEHVTSQLTLYVGTNLSPKEKLDKITDEIFSFQNEYGFIYEISEQSKMDYEENEVVANFTHTIDLIQRILDEGVAQNKFKKMNTRRTAQMLMLSYIGAIILRPVMKKKKSFFSYHLMLNNFYLLIRNEGVSL